MDEIEGETACKVKAEQTSKQLNSEFPDGDGNNLSGTPDFDALNPLTLVIQKHPPFINTLIRWSFVGSQALRSIQV